MELIAIAEGEERRRRRRRRRQDAHNTPKTLRPDR